MTSSSGMRTARSSTAFRGKGLVPPILVTPERDAPAMTSTGTLVSAAGSVVVARLASWSDPEVAVVEVTGNGGAQSSVSMSLDVPSWDRFVGGAGDAGESLVAFVELVRGEPGDVVGLVLRCSPDAGEGLPLLPRGTRR